MYLSTITLLAFLEVANAHHLVSNIIIDGVNQGHGTCMRVPPNTNPYRDTAGEDLACNIGGRKRVDFTCAANAGSSITAQWRTWPDGTQDAPLDESHKGPCAVYLKRMGDKGTGAVSGGGWFKIWEQTSVGGKWCSTLIAANGNKMDFKIPKDLAAGYYTMRMEQLALHEAQIKGGAQWFVGCAQIYLFSTGGSSAPASTVSIPGYTTNVHPGVLYNLYMNGNDPSPNYKIPGPAPYKARNTGGGAVIKTTFDPHPKYEECIVKNANWCGVSPPSFSNTKTCKAAASNCMQQAQVCYDSAPPTGNTGCFEWEAKCVITQTHCDSCDTKNCSGVFPAFANANVGRLRRRS